MPLGGLALAISLSTAIETTTLFLLLRKRLNGIQGMELAKGTGVGSSRDTGHVSGDRCLAARHA